MLSADVNFLGADFACVERFGILGIEKIGPLPKKLIEICNFLILALI